MLVIFNFQLGQDFFEPIYRGVLLHLTQTVLYVKSHFPSELCWIPRCSRGAGSLFLPPIVLMNVCLLGPPILERRRDRRRSMTFAETLTRLGHRVRPLLNIDPASARPPPAAPCHGRIPRAPVESHQYASTRQAEQSRRRPAHTEIAPGAAFDARTGGSFGILP